MLQASRSEATQPELGSVMMQVARLPFQHLTPLSGVALKPVAPRVIMPPGARGWAVKVVCGVPAAIENLASAGVQVAPPPPVAVRVPENEAFNSLPAGQGNFARSASQDFYIDRAKIGPGRVLQFEVVVGRHSGRADHEIIGKGVGAGCREIVFDGDTGILIS